MTLVSTLFFVLRKSVLERGKEPALNGPTYFLNTVKGPPPEFWACPRIGMGILSYCLRAGSTQN